MQKAKTQAFILKKRRLLNKDLVITLFTEDFGKLNIIAKGVKSITSRRSPHLQTGNFIEAVITRKSEWSYLQETSLISAFSTIKYSREKSNYQYLMLFIIDRLLPQDQKEPKTYQILKKFLVELATNEEFGMIDLEGYANLVLKNLGYLKENKKFGQLSILVEDLINERLPHFT